MNSDRSIGRGLVVMSIALWVIILVLMAATRNLPYDDKINVLWIIGPMMMIGGAALPCGVWMIITGVEEK